MKLCEKFSDNGLSDGSVRIYTSRIKSLIKQAESEDYGKMLDACIKSKDNSTKVISLKALMHLAKFLEIDEKLVEKRDKEFRRILKITKEKKTESKKVDLKEITKKIQKVKRELTKEMKKAPDDPKVIRKMILWQLYCCMLPRRSQEYRECKMEKNEEGNCWDAENERFIIREHKMGKSEKGKRITYNKTGKSQKIDYHEDECLYLIPCMEVKYLMKKLKEVEPEAVYVFPWKDGKKMCPVQFGRMQNKVLGLKTNELRSYAVSKHTKSTSKSTKKSQAISKAMGHSVDVQQDVYYGEDK